MTTATYDVQLRKIDDIKPYDRNPRLNDQAVDGVAASLQEFGFRQPIVVDEGGVIIVGHTRWKAAKKLGLAKVPVHIATDLPPEKVKAYRIADNKTGELAEWDFDILPIELAELKDGGFDLGVLAFDEEELGTLLSQAAGVTEGLTDPDEIPEPPDDPVTQRGDIWVLGDHRLMCGDSASPTDLDRLLDGVTIDLVNMDPPYNVKVEPRSNNAIAAGNSSFTKDGASKRTHHQSFDVARQGEKKATHAKMRAKDRPLENDFVTAEAFDEMLLAWFGNAARVLKPGGSFYIWGGYANLGNYPGPLKKCGLYFSQGVVWDKQHPVLTRKDMMGAFELCQPPDTKVLTATGTSAIQDLRDGDRVVSFSRHHTMVTGLRGGYDVRVTSRAYDGAMYGVAVGDRTSWATDGHIWSVRMTAAANSKWCVYLMQRRGWWRVGRSKLYTTWGLGVKQRMAKEGGESAWILRTFDDRTEASVFEQLVSVEYGIPTTFWTETRATRRTSGMIRRMYESLDLDQMERSARRALTDFGRDVYLPFISSGQTQHKFTNRASLLVRSCNLLPEVMAVPVPAGGSEARWESIRAIDVQRYRGPVHSMAVSKHHHYIADGMVTHNCFYGWKEGAGHHFYGPNNATDLWHVKKVNPQSMVHLTEKPVELAVRAIQYSSKPGDHVLDLFGGSGSTLIGCEQTGRRAFLMEIDQAYCDVIVQRWNKFTGKQAQRMPQVAAGEHHDNTAVTEATT